LILTPTQKQALLAGAGIRVVVVLRFTRELSLLSPEDFVRRVLCGPLKGKEVYVGANFRFGHGQAGDVGTLRKLSTELGFRLGVVPPVQVRGEIVSSTRIRGLVQAGEVAPAARLLGRPFALTGLVNPGHGIGRELKVPTLNLTAEQELLPARGVYATETLLDARGSPRRSVTNVGYRPTFGGDGLQIETHLIGFRQSRPANRIEVRFRARLRDERKFPFPQALKEQIVKDIERAEDFFRRDHRP
jgi:riboflavin kinase/FMN adenylyltransferase